jgi:hypothetical protein
MLDNLMNLIRQHAGDAIINNPAIPNERNDEAIQETGNSIISSLQNAFSGGNVKSVLNLFNGNADGVEQNPLVQDTSSGLQQRLQEKFNLNGQQASGIAGSLIPTILKQFGQKTADPNDNSFDLQDVFNQLSGGRTANLNMSEMVSKFKGGLDSDGDNDVDVQDLKSLLSGGSVMDKLKGLFN